jgi:molybdopterin/thiamine biosynthesis adenylyltransferase
MNAVELHFALSTEVHQRLESLLFPPGEPGEHGAIAIITPSSGATRRTLIAHSIVEPREGDVTWDADDGLLFSTSYKSRAADEACRVGGGLLFVHTHPLAMGKPVPSGYDLAADARDLFFLGEALGPAAPLVAAVVGGNRRWSVREYQFRGRTKATAEFATTMRVVGPGLSKFDLSAMARAAGHVDRRAQDSSIRLWGETGQEALGGLRVALVGAGGVGSILAEHVPRLGVGELVVIEFDRITRENFNRQQGSTREDVENRALKAEIACRIARASATAPRFKARSVTGSVVEAATIRDLLDCDVILNAADSAWARQVLDQLAHAHLIPVINGGTELRGEPLEQRIVSGKCEVTTTGPGHPCFECSGLYTVRVATEAREHPRVRGRRGYLRVGNESLDERSPSVISTNALVAGLMELRLQAIALATTPDATVCTQRYHVQEGTLDHSLVRSCAADCPRVETVGLGDLHPLPLGVDRDFEAARQSA